MAKDQSARFYGTVSDLKIKLSKYIESENDDYDELSLLYLNKWIWVYIYEEDYGLYLDINFSRDFNQHEIDLFLVDIENLGLSLPANNSHSFL